MSFINLMANDIWSDADITRRTEAMVRSEFSAEAETVLNRKVVAMTIGQYEPNSADMFEIAHFRDVVEAAQTEGVAARADMALLKQVMELEEAHRRLSRPLPSEDDPLDVKALDEQERSLAQGIVDSATQPVQALFEQRAAAALQL